MGRDHEAAGGGVLLTAAAARETSRSVGIAVGRAIAAFVMMPAKHCVRRERAMWRYLTAGESHGPGLTIIVDSVPAGVPLTEDAIAEDLRRRQGGYGRGGRMLIEKDRAELRAGVAKGFTTGAPVAMWIEN